MGERFSQVLERAMLSTPGPWEACSDGPDGFQILPASLGNAAMDPGSRQEDGRSSSAALSSSFINNTTHLSLWLANSSAITKMPEDFVMYF